METTAALPKSQSFEGARHQPSLGMLVDMELYKLRKRPMTLVIAGIMLAALTVFVALGYVISRANSSDNDLSGFLLPEIIPNSFDIIGGLGSILLVVLAASTVGSEFGWGTVRAMVGSGVSRTKLLAAKLLAITEIVVLFVIGGIAAGVVTSLVITVIGGHDLSFGWLDAAALGDIGIMFLGTVFVLFISAVIGFAVATVTRSLAAGIAIGIGYSIAESILGAILGSIGGIGDTISKALLSTNLNAITALNSFGGSRTIEDAPGPWQATLVLSIYCVVFLGIAFAVFRKRDIPSGS
jgi:ABC-2 type transport system permease protein